MSLTLNKQFITINQDETRSAEGYLVFDDDLVAAANAAISLGKPLLLTGEPGIGKSEFANWLAAQPEPCKLHRFIVKSTTEGHELFYHFDTLARFRDAQIEAHSPLEGSTAAKGKSTQPLHYLKYDALGEAILMSLGKAVCETQGLISDGTDTLNFTLPTEPTRSVVLIDEIDKAPRDVPNDILDEIDRLSFRVRELGNQKVDVNPSFRPIVIITSNSERDLPKPFLRRCIYYHMHFPKDTNVLRQIAEKRVGKRYKDNGDLLAEALGLFHHIRNEVNLNHQPGLAELLDWLADLISHNPDKSARLSNIPQARASLKNTLLKEKDDQLQVDDDWEKWLKASNAV
jgi:MoxR-like ATPase